MSHKLNKNDILISSALVLLVFWAMALLFPQEPIVQCSGTCQENAEVSDCSCIVVGYEEPFTQYYNIRLLMMIFIGAGYYYVKNKPKMNELLVAYLGIFLMSMILLMVSYMLMPVLGNLA